MLNISNEVIVDVGCPSICYEYVLLPLVNKEAALTSDRAEDNKVGNPSRERGRKRQS